MHSSAIGISSCKQQTSDRIRHEDRVRISQQGVNKAHMHGRELQAEQQVERRLACHPGAGDAVICWVQGAALTPASQLREQPQSQ